MNYFKSVYDWPHTPFFLWVLGLPLLVSAVIVFMIYPADGFDFCKSKECVEFALEYFSLPIKTLVFASALIALVFNYLRTHSQLLSAERQKQQNIFSNFYKHYEEYEKYMKTEIKCIDGWIDVNNINFRKLYSYFFPKAKEGNFEFHDSLKSKLHEIEQYRKIQDEAFPNKFHFEEHKHKLERLFKEMGILVECNTPQEFFKIEKDTYKLINVSVNYWWFDSTNLKMNFEEMSYEVHKNR